MPPATATVTSENPPGDPPSYCPDCNELFVTPGKGSGQASCPSCGRDVPVAAGRFSGIVNVVRFAARLTPVRRSALHSALQPDRQQADAGSLEARWAEDWLAGHQVASAPFWRRCLTVTFRHLSPTDDPVSEPQAAAIAREVAKEAGASRSFTPRRY